MPITSPQAPLREMPLHRIGRDLLALWHLLSLDAPTVATVWTLSVASAAHLRLPLRVPVAMFASVWVLYAADRLLDSRILAGAQAHHLRARAWQHMPEPLGAPFGLEARHFFHYRHRRPMIVGIIACALLLAALVPRLDPAALRLDLMLGSLLFAYFVLIHATASAHRLPKEISVGLFFSAAVFIPTVARAPDLRLTLAPVALLFAALCSLNCLFIYRWEHAADCPSSTRAEPHWLTRNATRHLLGLARTLVALSLLLSLATHRATSLPIALAALLLLGLDRLRSHLPPLTLRAAADLVLLTPLPMLLLQRAA